jgi:hypothetical protein
MPTSKEPNTAPDLGTVRSVKKQKGIVVVIAGSDRTTRRRGNRRQRDPSSFPFGPDLHQARERLGLSLETVQDRTGVRLLHLEALEAGDLSRLPDEKIALIAVRRFAEVVGLDGAAMTRSVAELWRKVMDAPTPDLTGTPRGPRKDPRPSATVPVIGVPIIPIPVGTAAAGTPIPGNSVAASPVASHLSRFPTDTSHLRAFTQTAQVPQVESRTVRPSLPPGLRFDSTDSLPVTRRSHRDRPPIPMALRVAVWTTLVLLVVSGVGIAVHHYRPAWLAKIHLVGTAGTSVRSHGTTAPAYHGPLVSDTAAGRLSAAVAVHSPVYEVVITTQAPCWLHVSSPTSFAPLFAATVPAGTTKTFTSGNGQLSVELGASHAIVTVQILDKTIPGWSLTPSSAPFVVNFHSVST